ncbi:hypothetical protein AS156_15430 [Bradyrhizobium macuxiense]|uniref:DUF4440 domain-containing protein n=2 Tax=Bradyrhizobium macuxiense TaxID=1755647 RepID=A0A125Q744_9BRAD|nr:hypothetical protein AS156_15430 [Bradyrhizobium macuxiense]
MRISYVISFVSCLLVSVFSIPAKADDANLKQEVEKVAAAYVDSFNKHDPAGIAARYTADGMVVNPTGSHTDIAEIYKGIFKTGCDHSDVTIDQVSPLGADAALGVGEYHLSGKNQSGEPINIVGRWTAVYVRDGEGLKIRMLSAFPKAPPPKD